VAKDLEITRDRIVIPHELRNDENDEPWRLFATDTKDSKLRGFHVAGIQELKVV